MILMSGSCEKMNCDDCIDSQRHYFDKLLLFGCDSDEPADARDRVDADCNKTKTDKAAYLEQVCNDNGTPSYDCD